jgi:hypothetical protein
MSNEPGRYIRKVSYRNVNWISLDKWMTLLNRGAEIYYKFKILKNVKIFKLK